MRATSAPIPGALNQFIDQNIRFGGGHSGNGMPPQMVEPPEFRPSSTFAGGVGGGFGTGGGFGSTGGFHTVRAASWQEPVLIKLDDAEPRHVPEASPWAPSRLAPGVAHMVNKIRADTIERKGQHRLRDAVDEGAMAGPIQGTEDGSAMFVMEPERYENFGVRIPPTKTGLPTQPAARPNIPCTKRSRASRHVLEVVVQESASPLRRQVL